MAITEADIARLDANAEQAAQLLKALSNKDRLMILCYLAEGERNVGDLERLLKLRQPTLSQQLSRLRQEGLVTTRRAGKAIYYSLASAEVRAVIGLLYRLYCSDAPAESASTAADAGVA
jgi:ArsR family transcriptional regulator